MIVGIGGISRAGKSFLASELVRVLSGYHLSVIVLDQDSFVLPEDRIPRIRDHVDWEIPESIDWPRLLKEVQQSNRLADIVIVEGLLALRHADLIRHYAFSIYIGLDQPEFVDRKKEDLRWGAEPDWYIEYIWQAHQLWGKPIMQPDLELDGSSDFDLLRIAGLILDRYRIVSKA